MRLFSSQLRYTRMAHDGLDEGLIDRLREKYANMSKTANDSAVANRAARKVKALLRITSPAAYLVLTSRSLSKPTSRVCRDP